MKSGYNFVEKDVGTDIPIEIVSIIHRLFWSGGHTLKTQWVNPLKNIYHYVDILCREMIKISGVL